MNAFLLRCGFNALRQRYSTAYCYGTLFKVTPLHHRPCVISDERTYIRPSIQLRTRVWCYMFISTCPGTHSFAHSPISQFFTLDGGLLPSELDCASSAICASVALVPTCDTWAATLDNRLNQPDTTLLVGLKDSSSMHLFFYLPVVVRCRRKTSPISQPLFLNHSVCLINWSALPRQLRHKFLSSSLPNWVRVLIDLTRRLDCWRLATNRCPVLSSDRISRLPKGSEC